jgi:hypothetical protein
MCNNKNSDLDGGYGQGLGAYSGGSHFASEILTLTFQLLEG